MSKVFKKAKHITTDSCEVMADKVHNSDSYSKSGLFTAGAVFATCGVKILTSKEAKKCYAKITAKALKAKDCVVKTANKLQENAEDIVAEAKVINEQCDKESKNEVVEDKA
ncbi:DUF6110 family protein [Mycoplasma sp. P36-A1]|uniref:DUF6110 family protein n=1 Tax=Mycoplasma sp. P36-A1 TaxID=3252900 RepID=UPI003C2FE460